MYDWIYALPLALLILGSGITYFMSSSLFGPFCITLSIVLIAFICKERKYTIEDSITVDGLHTLADDFAELAQCPSSIEKPNAGRCNECNSAWLLSDCERELDQETWELPPYTVYICPKCNAELDHLFYIEEDEELL